MSEQTPDLPDTSSGATPDEKPDLRDLLTQVAAGAVDPSEAARRLDAGSSVDEGARPGDAAGSSGDGPHVRVIPGSAPGPGPASGDEPPIDRIVVRATANKLILLADASVTGAAVEGSHVARRDGGTLVIDTDAEPSEGDFAFVTTTSRFTRRIGRWRGPETVIVKVRPDLPVEASVMAGSLVVDGLRAGMRFSVDAGSLKARDCSGPVDGRVASGSATLDWRLDSGASRLRCELGSIKVQLDPRSDVTVRARADLGSVDLGPSQVSGLNAQRELVVGAGTATLDMDVSLGSIKLGVG